MVSGHVKVALSGDGGDEVFAGYKWYDDCFNDFNLSKNNAFSNAVAFIKKVFGWKPPHLSNFESYYNKLLLDRFDDDKFRKFFSPDSYRMVSNEDDNLFDKYIRNAFEGIRAIQYVDLNTFMVDDILTKVDRASMAHSLEVRVPLLDYKLVEAVFSLDEKDFPSNSTGKPVLKKTMGNRLPDQIINREKKGFSAPVHTWKGFQDIGISVVNGNTIKDGLFQGPFIRDLIDDKYPNSQGMLWMIFVFDKWYQRWFCEINPELDFT
jgi:asparagine synthase (glutamine-hydrolysing)